jgi:hypothetical protein
MKSQAGWLLMGLMLIAFCVAGWTARARQQSAPRQQWEYTFEVKGNPKKWNALGEQGWELVTCTESSGIGVSTCYFKRPK